MGFLERVKTNTDRYVKIFAMIIDKEMPVPSINFKEEEKTTFDIIMEQRRFNLQSSIQAQTAAGYIKEGQQLDAKAMIPPELERQY